MVVSWCTCYSFYFFSILGWGFGLVQAVGRKGVFGCFRVVNFGFRVYFIVRFSFFNRGFSLRICIEHSGLIDTFQHYGGRNYRFVVLWTIDLVRGVASVIGFVEQFSIVFTSLLLFKPPISGFCFLLFLFSLPDTILWAWYLTSGIVFADNRAFPTPTFIYPFPLFSVPLPS